MRVFDVIESTIGLTDYQTAHLSRGVTDHGEYATAWLRLQINNGAFPACAAVLRFNDLELLDRTIEELNELRAAWLVEEAAQGIRYAERIPKMTTHLRQPDPCNDYQPICGADDGDTTPLVELADCKECLAKTNLGETR